MTVRSRLRASTLGAFLIFTATPVYAATGTTPALEPSSRDSVALVPGGQLPDLGPNVTVGRLASGGTVIVRPTQGSPVAAIELWYRAPSVGYGTKPLPALARVAAQAVAGSKPIVGQSLGKLVADLGGRLAITVYSNSVAISAIVPATAVRDVVKTMTTAFFAPVTTADGFRDAQRDVAAEALVSTFDAETSVRDALFAQIFSGGSQHYPSLGDSKAIAAVTFDDVKTFATRAFRAQNGTLVVSGAVDASVASAAVAGRATADVAAEPAIPVQLAAATQPVTKTFVQSSGGYGWIGPAITDQREATAMDFIADYLFRIEDGVVAKAVATQAPDSLLVGQFITLHDPGIMFVAYAGKDTSALRALVDAGFASVRKPLAVMPFKAALESFKYHLLSDLQTPTQLADNFGWYSVEGSPAYAPGVNGENGAYFKAVATLTPDFIAAVAEKYLGKPPVVVTLEPEKPQEKAAPSGTKAQ